MSSTLRKSGGEGWQLRRSQQQNWSNVQDLPPGSCQARGSELLQKVDSFGTLPHLPCLGETGRGRVRDRPQNGRRGLLPAFCFSSDFSTQRPHLATLCRSLWLKSAGWVPWGSEPGMRNYSGEPRLLSALQVVGLDHSILTPRPCRRLSREDIPTLQMRKPQLWKACLSLGGWVWIHTSGQLAPLSVLFLQTQDLLYKGSPRPCWLSWRSARLRTSGS